MMTWSVNWSAVATCGSVYENSFQTIFGACGTSNISSVNRSKELVEICPNPSSGEFFIDAKQMKGNVVIYNSIGEKVFDLTLNPSSTGEGNGVKINLHVSGIYNVIITSGEGVCSKKVVVVE
jgi:hypothetical protein